MDSLPAIRDALAAQLDRCADLLEEAGGDDDLLALRDLLLDFQLESRGLITEIEARLGAFSGEDDPRAVAVNAEALIEETEGLQDGWESRVNILLDAGFEERRLAEFLDDALADREGLAVLDEFFSGLPSDMDRTGQLLDYAKRYLLSLLDQAPSR